MSKVGKELMDVPLAEMIKSLGLGIAVAQFELDKMSMRLAQMMTGDSFEVEVTDPATGAVKSEERRGFMLKFGKEKLSLLELGFTPTFYQFVDTIIEVKMSITMTSESSTSGTDFKGSAEAHGGLGFFSAKAGVNVASVSASYASKYQYSAEGASLIRTKLVPVPPPAILEERIRRMLDNRGAT